MEGPARRTESHLAPQELRERRRHRAQRQRLERPPVRSAEVRQEHNTLGAARTRRTDGRQRRGDPARSRGRVLGGVLPGPSLEQLRQARPHARGKAPVGLGRGEERRGRRGRGPRPDGVGRRRRCCCLCGGGSSCSCRSSSRRSGGGDGSRGRGRCCGRRRRRLGRGRSERGCLRDDGGGGRGRSRSGCGSSCGRRRVLFEGADLCGGQGGDCRSSGSSGSDCGDGCRRRFCGRRRRRRRRNRRGLREAPPGLFVFSFFASLNSCRVIMRRRREKTPGVLTGHARQPARVPVRPASSSSGHKRGSRRRGRRRRFAPLDAPPPINPCSPPPVYRHSSIYLELRRLQAVLCGAVAERRERELAPFRQERGRVFLSSPDAAAGRNRRRRRGAASELLFCFVSFRVSCFCVDR